MSSTAETHDLAADGVTPAVTSVPSVDQTDTVTGTVIAIHPEVDQEPDYEPDERNEKTEDVKAIVKDDPVVDPEIEQGTNALITWKGQFPFAGAVAQYKPILTAALQDAERDLATNPDHARAPVNLPLFDPIVVMCTDANGTEVKETFMVHEAHYGPMARKRFHHSVPAKHRYWLDFYNRFHRIWVLMGQTGKAPGGDGSGKDGTACAPFRDAQVEYLKKGLYLIDASQVEFDQEEGRYWYNIQIYLYRSPPLNGPFRVPHGYGFIPGLGPAHITAIPAVNDQPSPSNRGSNQRGRGGTRRGRGGNQLGRGGNRGGRGTAHTGSKIQTKLKSNSWAADN